MKSKIVEDADVVTYGVVCDPGDEAVAAPNGPDTTSRPSPTQLSSTRQRQCEPMSSGCSQPRRYRPGSQSRDTSTISKRAWLAPSSPSFVGTAPLWYHLTLTQGQEGINPHGRIA